MNVRIGTVDDIQIIARLHTQFNEMMAQLQPRDYQGIREDEARIEKNLQNNQLIYLLVEDEGEVRGLSLVESIETARTTFGVSQQYACINQLIIGQQYRGYGYGHALLEAVKGWARKHQIAYIQLNVQTNNVAALMFYEKEGFQDFQKIMRLSID